MDNIKVSVLGCGWFGLPFAKSLAAKGFFVNGSTTSASKISVLEANGIQPFVIDLNSDEQLPVAFFDVDVLVVCVPPRAKTESADSYPLKLKKIADAARKHVKHVLFISSTGIFEDGNFEVDERNTPKPTTAAGKALQAAEQVFLNHSNFSTTIIRFAGLIGPDRNLAKYFAGRVDIPNGQAPINLIHLVDCIGLCTTVIAQKAFGKIYHAVTPHHPSRQDFYTALCINSEMKKPAFINALAEWKIVDSCEVATNVGYNFVVKDWFSWMEKNKL